MSGNLKSYILRFPHLPVKSGINFTQHRKIYHFSVNNDSMNRFIYVFIFPALYIFFSCNPSSKSSSTFMAFDDIEYVDNFPQSFPLQNSIEQNVDAIGVKSFCIYDSSLLMSTVNPENLWVFASLPECHIYGNALKRGHGPTELIENPSVHNNTKIIKENGQLLAYIYEFKKGNLLKLNITESLRTNKTDISTLNDSLPKSLFNFVVINDSVFFCKEVNNNHTQQIRYIYKPNDNRVSLPVFEKLNNAVIKNGEDINILSTMTKYNPTNNIIIEMPIGLNYINMYSLDNSYTKTICIGKGLYSIEGVQATHRWDRIYTFADLRLFEKFWGVLYMNETEKDFQTNRKHFPTILLFDWSGNPLAELKLTQLATSFDIDINTGELYTFDFNTELFFKYSIQCVLSGITK